MYVLSSQEQTFHTYRRNSCAIAPAASPGISASSSDTKRAGACDGAGWGLGGRKIKNHCWILVGFALNQ